MTKLIVFFCSALAFQTKVRAIVVMLRQPGVWAAEVGFLLVRVVAEGPENLRWVHLLIMVTARALLLCLPFMSLRLLY